MQRQTQHPALVELAEVDLQLAGEVGEGLELAVGRHQMNWPDLLGDEHALAVEVGEDRGRGEICGDELERDAALALGGEGGERCGNEGSASTQPAARQ